MSNENGQGTGDEAAKERLQKEMARTRESLAETIGDIRDTVELEVEQVKETVAGVLDFREAFQKEPLVWSLGALSAGFALGYTVGYGHKKMKGRNQKEITVFADNMIEQLSSMGNGMVLPMLDAKISEMFGFNFSAMLEQIGDGTRTTPKNKTKRIAAPKRKPAPATKAKAATKNKKSTRKKA